MRTFLSSIRLPIIFSTLALAVVFAGCRGPQKPDPSMTAVRGQGSGGSGADYINPDDIANSGLGLSMRDPDMLGEGNRLENLFSPIYFDFDQSFIRPADRPTLMEVSDYLESNPAAKLLVEGHCDWRGTTEYNMALGDRRAGSVADYVVQLGITADRVETVSKGDLESMTEGSEEQMRTDRRADLIIIP